MSNIFPRTSVKVDRGLYPYIERFIPISFMDIDTTFDLTAGQAFRLPLSNYVAGSMPIRYYLTKSVHWITLKDGVLSGIPPADLASIENFEVEVVVRNTENSGTIRFQLALDDGTIVDDFDELEIGTDEETPSGRRLAICFNMEDGE